MNTFYIFRPHSPPSQKITTMFSFSLPYYDCSKKETKNLILPLFLQLLYYCSAALFATHVLMFGS